MDDETLVFSIGDYKNRMLAQKKDSVFGKIIKINDKEIEINTKNATLIYFEASWKTKFFMAISNPSIAYIFLIIAMYGILFEMMNPGSIFPGVIGAISALIAMYALNILPFNYVGLFLIFLSSKFTSKKFRIVFTLFFILSKLL